MVFCILISHSSQIPWEIAGKATASNSCIFETASSISTQPLASGIFLHQLHMRRNVPVRFPPLFNNACGGRFSKASVRTSNSTAALSTSCTSISRNRR